MKLKTEEITQILEEKGFICTNIEDYKNLDTILHLQCKNGHQIDASIKTVRNVNFTCPYCTGQNSKSDKINNIKPPEKSGYRIAAIDNATSNIGVSIFDSGKLVYYNLIHIEGDTVSRLVKNRQWLENIVINEWQPDLIVLEDIQYQNNIQTFKTLAMLLGNAVVSSKINNIKYETVLSKVWRSHFLINGKNRIQQKIQAIEQVKKMYGIEVIDDIAEAILLGKYAADMTAQHSKKLF